MPVFGRYFEVHPTDFLNVQLVCLASPFSSRLIVLVEVARVEKVGLSGKVVLVLFAIEAGTLKRILGSDNQDKF